MKKAVPVLLCVFLSAVMIGCITDEKPKTNFTDGGKPDESYTGKTILYLNSYHEGYEWSDGITKGIR